MIEYRPDTGQFFWRVCPRPGAAAYLGKPISTKRHGYQFLRLFGHQYAGGRLAWFYMTKTWPSPSIDHINGNRADDRFVNLREATWAQQSQNVVRTKSNTGIQGVYRDGNRYRALIGLDGTIIKLGTFDTLEEAVAARKAGKAKYHQFQPEQREGPERLLGLHKLPESMACDLREAIVRNSS
jgi:hypothetical protein